MTKYTIVPADNMVIIDGEAHVVDCAAVDPKIHAIQWSGTAGWIEFVDADPYDGQCDPHRPLTDFAPWQHLIDDWTAAKAAAATPPPAPKPVGAGAHVIAS